MRITTPAEREKALNRIFQCALLHRVAVITTDRKPVRSVQVVDVETNKEFVDDIVELEPERLVGIYARGDRKHADLLDALKDDIATAAAAFIEQEPTRRKA